LSLLSFKVLDVSSSTILGDHGSAFCAALGQNSALKTLDLTDCKFDGSSLGALAAAMVQSRGLETLVMDAGAAKGLMEVRGTHVIGSRRTRIEEDGRDLCV
jgi:hypothetical protein